MNTTQIRISAVAAIVLLAAAPIYLSPFSITLLNYIGVYALTALGLVLLTGVGGMVSFGQAAFVGIAAYATAWATTTHALSPWLGLGIALILTSTAAAVIGAVTLRLGGHFLALSTVAWGLAISFLFGNIEGLGRFNGISGIPPIAIGTTPLIGSAQIFYLIWFVLIAALLVSLNLLQSREGRAMRALRGGNLFVESLGISAFRVRLVTFVLAAVVGGHVWLALRASGALRQPLAFRRSRRHRLPDDGHGGGRYRASRRHRRCRKSSPSLRTPSRTICR